MAPLSRAPGYTATQHSMRVPQDHASGLRPIEWNSSSDTDVPGSFESALADRVARREVGTVECTVTSTADAGAGTLRSCIADVNGEVVCPGDATQYLAVSGACRADLNGAYFKQGTTNDGKPYYKGGAGGGHYIYHDRDCNGGSVGTMPRWIFDNSKPSTTADEDLDGDGNCFYAARIDSTFNDPPAGGNTWRMFCDGWKDVRVTLETAACDEKPRIVFDFLDNADDQSVDGAASVTITLETELPAIAVPMVIDGGTRSYVVEGDGGSAKRTTVGVILDGSGLLGTKDGLKLSADDVELRGIAIVGFSYNGVAVYGKRAKVQGEFRDNGEAGVRVWPAALDAFIGGGSSQLPTIIGGNANGIHCEATRLTVQGNVFIGVDAESNDLGNSKSGVWLNGAATFATIGSSNSNSTDGIVIGCNNAHGICSQAPLLLIAGNVYIGEDPHGKKIGNSQNGVYSSSYDLTIGSDSTDAAVVIGWNLQNGISGRNKRLSVVGNVFIVGNGYNGISIQGSDAIIGTIDSTAEFGGMASEINIYIYTP